MLIPTNLAQRFARCESVADFIKDFRGAFHAPKGIRTVCRKGAPDLKSGQEDYPMLDKIMSALVGAVLLTLIFGAIHLFQLWRKKK